MAYLIKRAAKYRLQLFLLGAAILALVLGVSLFQTTEKAEASNPNLQSVFTVEFPNYPDGQQGTGEGNNHYTYLGGSQGSVSLTLHAVGSVPSGEPTVEISGAANADATITVDGGVITVTVDNAASHLHNNPSDPNDPLNGKLDITVTYPDGSCWHGYITIVTVADWTVGQKQKVTRADGTEETRVVNSFGNGVAFPLVRSEGGSFKFCAGFDLSDGGAGNGNYKMVLSGLPDGESVESAPGVTSHDFEFTLPTATLQGHRINLALVNKDTGEKICVTPLIPGGSSGPGITWGGGHEQVTPTPVSRTSCSTCSEYDAEETVKHTGPASGTKCMAGYTDFSSDSDNLLNTETSAGTTAAGEGGASASTRGNNLGGSPEGGGSLPASEDPASPSSLKVMATESAQVTLDPTNTHPSVIKTAVGSLKVENVQADGYTLNFYKTGGTQPQTCLIVKRPAALENGYQTLRYIEQRYGSNGPGTGSIVETKYSQKKNADGTQDWIIWEGAEIATKSSVALESAFLRKTEIARTAISDSEHSDTVTISERRADNSAWEIISIVKNTYRHYAWGSPIIKRQLDPAGKNLTSTWEYHSNNTLGLRTGLPKSYTSHTGYWAEIDWDAHGRLARVKTPYGSHNAAPGAGDGQCRVLTVSYGVNGLTRREQTSIYGTPVSETLITDLGFIRSITRLASPGADPGAGGNLTTAIARAPVAPLQPGETGITNFIYRPNSHKIETITYPDGTRHTCTWSYSGSNRIQDCRQGNSALDQGTRSHKTYDHIGNLVETKNYALDFGDTASPVEQLLNTVTRDNLDGLCRPQDTTTTFADGSAAQISTILYGCCGLKTSTDIRGITTTYHHDHLKRLETSETLSVVRATQYNGLTRKTLRFPKPQGNGYITVRGTSHPGTIIQGESEYNTAHEHTASRSASPQSADGTTLVTTSYSYSYGAGITTTANYPDGGQTVTTSLRDGRTLSVTGSAVNDMTYEYGTPSTTGLNPANGAVLGTQATQANGTQFTLSGTDFLGRPVETHFADGNKATMHYNPLGQLERSVDPDGVTTLYAYNNEGQRTHRAADLNGNNTIDLATDRVTFTETNATTGHNSGTHVWETITKVYGTTGGNLETGKSQRSIDGLKSWSIPFAIGARASSSVTELKVNGINGNWTTTTVSPTGLTSIATHTGGLLRTTITRGADSVETLNSTSYFYDLHNRTNKTTDARTGDTTVAYLNNDQQSTVTQVRAGGNALTTTLTYDPMGRTLTTDSPDTTDDQNNLLTNTITRTYDKRGNILTVDGHQTYKRHYTYDTLSRLTTLKTFGTQTSITTWNYNPQRGWLDNKKYPDANNPLNQGLGTHYSYTPGGRLKTRLWARGTTTTWHYDFEGNNTGFGANAKAGDLQGTTYSDGTPDVSYTYKQWGAIAAIADVTGTRHLTYRETIDLALETENTSAATSPQQQISIPRKHTRLYDTLGRTTHGLLGTPSQTDALATAISGGSGTNLAIDHVQAYNYDGQTGRISGIIHGNAKSVIPEAPFTCAYVQDSHLPLSTDGPAHKVTNLYETHRDILKKKTNTDQQTATLSAINYGPALATTDAVNGIGQRTYAERTFNNNTGNAESWKYNPKGELTSSVHSITAKSRNYTFDGIGNRTSMTDNNGTTASTPNPLNQLSSIGGTTRSHDPDGNLLDDGTKLYAWDAENRLVMIQQKSDNAIIAEYRYDHMSRRIYKQTTAAAPQGAGATLYHYEGWNLCAEYNATAISGTAPNITSATITTLKRTYTWGMDLSGSMQGAGGVGGLLAIEEKTGTHQGKYYPLYDGNGNITELIKSNGNSGTTLVAHYQYDPFGNLIQNDNKINPGTPGYNDINPFRFSTKYHDEETGLYYYGYRYYDAAVGRFINRDPIEEEGGLNLYGFAYNEPIGSIDYLGLSVGGLLGELCKKLCDSLYPEPMAQPILDTDSDLVADLKRLANSLARVEWISKHAKCMQRCKPCADIIGDSIDPIKDSIKDIIETPTSRQEKIPLKNRRGSGTYVPSPNGRGSKHIDPKTGRYVKRNGKGGVKDRIRPKGNRSPRTNPGSGPGMRIGTGAAGLIIDLGLSADTVSVTAVRALFIAQNIKCKNCWYTHGVGDSRCNAICDKADRYKKLMHLLENHME